VILLSAIIFLYLRF